jgi:tetratricopeptide (TPR) repeat protein
VPPSTADILATGQHYHRAGALARAEELYRQVVATDPTHAEAWILLGRVCQGLGRFDEAAEHHRQALRLQPDAAPAHNGLGIALARLGDLAGAEASFRRAVALRPQYAQGLNNLGNALKEMKRFEEARACYAQAVAADPGFDAGCVNLGWLLVDLDRPAEAEANFRKALTLRPDSGDAQLGLAGALAAQRCWQDAVAAGAGCVQAGSASDEAALPLPARTPHPRAAVLVEISPGELLDKITILQIKSRRITNPAKLRNVAAELQALEPARQRALPDTPALAALASELQAVNEALWNVEDDLRICERDRDFGPRFVELARSVYRTNDRRAALKRRVNELLGARIVEEKSYVDYGP